MPSGHGPLTTCYVASNNSKRGPREGGAYCPHSGQEVGAYNDWLLAVSTFVAPEDNKPAESSQVSKNPTNLATDAPSWLGLPDPQTLSEALRNSTALAWGARTAGTNVTLLAGSGEELASAGAPSACTRCNPRTASTSELFVVGNATRSTCPHGLATVQVPVIVESSRAATLVFGPFLTHDKSGLPDPGPLERVTAAAELTAHTLSLELLSALGRATSERNAVGRDEERLRLALEATSDAIWDWDLETNRTYYSPRWFTMLGYEPGAFDPTFETWAQMTLAGDVERTKGIIAHAIEAGTGYEAEFCMRHADGSLRWILGRGRVSGRDANGRPTRMSGTNTDITERKRVQAEQAALEARLQQAEKLAAMGQLAGGIAHDFNNQLTVVLGNATVLRNHLREPHEVNLLDNLVSAASRTAELTRKLLAFAHVDRQFKTGVDLHKLISDAEAMLGEDDKIKIVRLLQASPSLVDGEATALASAILSLALNAREAMPDGGTLTFSTRSVWLDEERAASILPGLAPGPYVRLAVSDTGRGMYEDVMNHLFEPFFTTKPVGQGPGMGLAAAYGTVRSHAGAIQVDTKIGEGSTFAMYLPYAVQTTQNTPPALHPEGESTRREKTGKRVLVVDDEPLVRDALLALIQAFGYEAECCADGPSAISALKAKADIGLVILDLVLPGMGGPAIFRAMRALRPDLQLLISSGYADSEECRELLAEGATGTLAKPFRAQELAQTLETLLGAPDVS